MPSFLFYSSCLLFFTSLLVYQSSQQAAVVDVEVWCDRLNETKCLQYSSTCNPYYLSSLSNPSKPFFAGCAYGSVEKCEKQRTTVCVKYTNVLNGTLFRVEKGCPSSTYFSKWDCSPNGKVLAKLLPSTQSTDSCVKSTLYKGDIGFALQVEPLPTLKGDISELTVKFGAVKNLVPSGIIASAAGEYNVPLFGLPFASPSIRVFGAHVREKSDLKDLDVKFSCKLSQKHENLGDVVVKLVLKAFWPSNFNENFFVQQLSAVLNMNVNTIKIIKAEKIVVDETIPKPLPGSFPYQDGTIVLEFQSAQSWLFAEKLALMVRLDHPSLHEKQLSISQVRLQPKKDDSPKPTTPITPTTPAPTQRPTTRTPTQKPTTSTPTRATTQAPTTKAPTTPAPTRATTRAPTTPAPTRATTKAPTTSAPTTKAPTTPAPTRATTHAPTTKAPTTPTPTRATTKAPTTPAPTRATTQTPTTRAPTTPVPTRATTQAPTTSAPTRATTHAPTTHKPTISKTKKPTGTKKPTKVPTQATTTAAPQTTSPVPTQTPTAKPTATRNKTITFTYKAVVTIRIAQKADAVSSNQVESDLASILEISQEEVKVVSITVVKKKKRQAGTAGAEVKVQFADASKANEFASLVNSKDPRLAKSSLTFLSASVDTTDPAAPTSSPTAANPTNAAPAPTTSSEKVPEGPSGRSDETSRTALIVITVSIGTATLLALVVMIIAYNNARRPTPGRLMY